MAWSGRESARKPGIDSGPRPFGRTSAFVRRSVGLDRDATRLCGRFLGQAEAQNAGGELRRDLAAIDPVRDHEGPAEIVRMVLGDEGRARRGRLATPLEREGFGVEMNRE